MLKLEHRCNEILSESYTRKKDAKKWKYQFYIPLVNLLPIILTIE